MQRGHNFAVVDEVDSILIDEARTPLIISGMGSRSSELYGFADNFVRTLKKYKIAETDSKANLEDLAKEVKNGGRNLIFGMLSSANRQQNGFSNAFATATLK